MAFEATPEAATLLNINGLTERTDVQALAKGSRVMWFKDECVQMLTERCVLEPGSPDREDVYYHMAFKAKIHRAIPESGYTARFEIADDEPIDREIHYRVRVEQRNGQRAWSSPIWVRP